MSENLGTIILGSLTGIVDPTTVTPEFIGQSYLNTVTNTLFFAKSLTIGDYEEIIDINSPIADKAHDQNTDTKLDDGQVNEVISLDLRTHLDNLTKHRLINDGISTTTNLYSASQIDTLIVASTSNLDIKNSVVTVADTNVTLSGEQTLNGVLTNGSRVGIVGQTLSKENGIYDTSTGVWTRATDADVDSEVTNGLSFFVSNSGSTKNGNQYILITADPITLGTTPLTFIEVPRIVLGTTSGKATEGNDSRLPTQDENDALVGTNGTPSTANKYVTNSDVRLHTQDTDTILTTDGIVALINAGILKTNLLTDNGINIQIDEIRARDGNGLKLNDDAGNGIFVEDGGNVGIGTISPNTSAKLQIDSTIQGVLNPRLTTSQRDAIASPATGLEIYNTSRKHPEFFNGSTWRGTEEGTLNVVYFTSASDLPAPVSGVITLEENTTYIMYNDDPTASQKQVILTDRLQIPDDGSVRITSVGLATCLLVYTGTGKFITTSSNFTGFLHIDELFVSCPNGTLFDLDSVLPVGSEFFPRIFLSNFTVFDTDTLGTIKTINVNFNVGAFFSCKQGLILDGVEEFLIGDWRFANWQNVTDAIMITSKNKLRFPKIQNCTFETLDNETAFNIEPNIGNETYIMSGNSYRGTGTLYHIGISGVIASIANASTSGSVTAVSGTSFDEVIMTDVAHGLVKGEVITTSGFSDSNYNGIFEILEIIDSDNFRIHTLFTATGTGSWNSSKITVSDIAHGLVVDDGVQLKTDDFSLGYNDGYRVLSNTADTFVVNATFTSTDTGIWSTDSLTETDPRLRIIANAGISDSKFLAFGEMNANTLATTVTNNIYVPLNINGFTQNTVTQRFILTNATTGEFTYIGSEDLDGEILAIVNAIKSGSSENYRFAISINGATPVFATAPFDTIEVKTAKISVSVLKPISIINGQTIKIMIAGDGTNDNLTITDLTINITD